MASVTLRRRLKKFLLFLEVLFILVMGAGMGVVLAAYYQMNKLLPPDAALDHWRPPVGSTIWSADGYLLAKLAVENRTPVPYEKIPQVMRDAIVAIEDSRFWAHQGLDYRGLARALWANLRDQDVSQGGSTITQQLARRMFLNAKKKLSRKIREMLIAVQIERNWTKKKILETYLNEVYFGAGAYGVSTAAQTYFGKPLAKLELEEAAMLAGLVQRPTEVNPYIAYRDEGNFDRTLRRRNAVLDRMASQGLVTHQEAEAAKEKPIKVLKERPRARRFYRAHYFVQYVLDELRSLGYDEDILDRAGYRIYTTLSWKMQEVAEQEARAGVDRWRRSRVSEAALVCVDPHDGYIRALVGGVNQPWEKYQFDVASRGMRQPGSAFKTFVYTAALERGDTPRSSVAAAAKPVKIGPNKYYAPKNHGRSGGSMGYVPAFAASVNGAAHNVCLKVGPKAVAELATRMGLKGEMRAYASIALGASEATPLEMAAAYGVFPARGKLAQPMAVTQIKSQEGELLEEFRPRVKDLGLKPTTISGMDTLTRAVVTSGTGRAASVVPNAHGKTGTSEEYTDAWFVGYTPELACAVWAGNRDNSRMGRVYGGDIACPIWARFMKRALELNPAKGRKRDPADEKAEKEAAPREREKRERPVTPPGVLGEDGNDRNRIRVTVCADSGLIAGPACRHRATEEYMLGEQPVSRCTLSHGARQPRPRDGDGDPPDGEPRPPDEPGGTRPDPDPTDGR